jgi:hypothetical protein
MVLKRKMNNYFKLQDLKAYA